VPGRAAGFVVARRRFYPRHFAERLCVSPGDFSAAGVHCVEFFQLHETDCGGDVVQMALEADFVHVVFPPVGAVDFGAVPRASVDAEPAQAFRVRRAICRA